METDSVSLKNNEARQFRKKAVSAAIRIIISTIILYFVFTLVTWQNVLEAYKSAEGKYILYGTLLLAGNLGIRTYKWRLMLQSVKKSPSPKESFGSVMLGILLGSFTPGEIGEFAGRAVHISDAKKSHLLGLALLDKAQISVITAAAGIISLLYLFLNNNLIIISASLLAIIFFYIFFMRMDVLASLGHRLNSSLFQKPWLAGILDGFTLIKRKQLNLVLICTLVFHLILVFQMFFFIRAFSEISFLSAFIGTSAMMFVKSWIPISLSDIGVREASSIYFFSKFGIPQAASLNASLLLFVVNVLVPSAYGIIFLKDQHVKAWLVIRSFLFKSKDK